jgi:cytochrome c peroxidase
MLCKPLLLRVSSLLLVASCASDAGRPDASTPAVARDAGDDAAKAATEPVLSARERDMLATLSSDPLPAPPPDVSNAFADDTRAAELGQVLFFDARLSGALLDGDNDGSKNALGVRGETGRVSCAGCHMPGDGFNDYRTLGGGISLGAGWGSRRTLSLLDVGQAQLLMWDGRRDTLYNQVFGPFESAVEMNTSRLFVAQQVFANHRAAYEAIFGSLPPLDDSKRFPPLTAELTGCQHLDSSRTPPVCDGTRHGMPGDGAEYDGMSTADQDAITRVVVNVGKAIGAYERRLRCGPGRFDAFIQGQSAMLTDSEQRGAALFVGKGRCIECHSGPYLSDHAFHNLGLRAETVAISFRATDDPGASVGLQEALADPLNVKGSYSDGDDGRLPTSVDAAKEGAFRTPTLRCAGGRRRFMHTGQLQSLEEVVSFLSRGGDRGGFVGTNELVRLDLSVEEQADLVAFLLTLDGPGPDEALRKDPSVP